mmetsp:Transcript_32479/g.48620  ORF Transcript_32479/g.48620 Transcript_32479/m.48620 type:complete len:186 (-) Transcript_32479:129-686(-)
MYLSDEGGPTILFTETAACAILPKRGRYMLFQGDLPHGVLHPLEEHTSAPFSRLTLLLNWWRERPPGLSEAPEIPFDSREVESIRGRDEQPSQLLRGCLQPTPAASASAAATATAAASAAPTTTTPATTAPIAASSSAAASLPFEAHAEAWKRQTLPQGMVPSILSNGFATTSYRDAFDLLEREQ